MKTAISIPDDVFQAAERLAKRLKKSRSQVYTEALRQYTRRHSPEEITEAWNQLAEEVDTRPDPFLREAARRVLEQTEW